MRIYLDHNATTPVDPAVVAIVTEVLHDQFGNASSVHLFGQSAKSLVDRARAEIATLIGARPQELVFTSCGTESDNLAIRGVAEASAPGRRRHLVASAIEHEAVLNTLKALAKRGWTTTLLPIDESGIVTPAALESAMTDETALVSVMHANNEIGTVQPIAALAEIAHRGGALFHTDAVQSVGKIPVAVDRLDIDLLSLSAHKFNGPKGVGALWVRRGTRLVAAMTGGRQERNRRAGTENVAGISGLGVAARIAMTSRCGDEAMTRCRRRDPSLRNRGALAPRSKSAQPGRASSVTDSKLGSWPPYPARRSTARLTEGFPTPRTLASTVWRPNRYSSHSTSRGSRSRPGRRARRARLSRPTYFGRWGSPPTARKTPSGLALDSETPQNRSTASSRSCRGSLTSSACCRAQDPLSPEHPDKKCV